MKSALLPDRGVVKVSGADARSFLNGLLTADIEPLAPGRARFAALLTPQGKIVVDALVIEAPASDGGGFFFDLPKALAAELVTRLGFYKLRAKVVIENLSDALCVMAVWEGRGTTEYGLVYDDPRLTALGQRAMLPPQRTQEAATDLGAPLTDAAEYEAHRIGLGVPRGGLDFIYGDAFPHEADMDQLGGVDFDKGCYVGQEVVSRMQHRGTARTRIVPVIAQDHAPETGLPVVAGEKQVGATGSFAGRQGLAMLRLDRLADAAAAGAALTAGGIVLTPQKPAWATFDVPGA